MGLLSKLLGGSKEPAKPELPSTLSELYAFKQKKPKFKDDCDREIMKLIQKAYDEDLLVFDSSSDYDYSKTLRRVQSLLQDSWAIRYEHPEKEQGYILYLDIYDRAFKLSQADPSLTFQNDGNFGAEAWYYSAQYLTDGKYVPRDVRRATLLTRQHIMFTIRMQTSIWWMDLERMLEIPADGEISKALFLKMDALMYGYDGLQLREGYIRENYHALELAQLAEYLYQMDYEKLRSDDHRVVIAALNEAVSMGNPFAKYLLGKYYIKGVHVEEDFEKGAALVDEAVQAGLSRPANYLRDAYSDRKSSVDDKNKKERAALEKKAEYYQTIHGQLKKKLDSYVSVLAEYMSSADDVANWQPESTSVTPNYASSNFSDTEDTASSAGWDEPDDTKKRAVSGFPYTMTDSYGVQWSLVNDMGYAAEYVSAGGSHRTVNEEELSEGHWHF